MLQASLIDATGKAQGQIDLPENLFPSISGSRYVLHEVIIALQRNQRRGTSSTKTRGLVSGGGRKPWKQKGTGNARAGSIRSPLWRKGGIIFGPLPRSYRVDLDEAKKNAAILAALSQKAKADQVAVIESLGSGLKKTSEAVALFGEAGRSNRTLLVVDKLEKDLARVVRNIPWLDIVEARRLNAWMLMRAHKIVFMKAVLDRLAERLQG